VDYFRQLAAAEHETAFTTDRLKVAAVYEERAQHCQAVANWFGLETASV
jgi:hypothetical protein